MQKMDYSTYTKCIRDDTLLVDLSRTVASIQSLMMFLYSLQEVQINCVQPTSSKQVECGMSSCYPKPVMFPPEGLDSRSERRFKEFKPSSVFQP